MHLHILGICGTFMGGLAALAREAGHTVTGCDAGVYPPMSDQLRALGIDLVEGYGADQMAFKPDVFVVGNVVSRARLPDGQAKFPLMESILNAGAAYTSGPQWLADHLLPGRHVLAVAGTHGKTTTTSMLAWILEACGREPGFLVGGVPLNFGVSARLGRGRPFVIEADEYDTAFFDKRSKFLHYRAEVAVFNNLEFDHADIFSDLAAIETQFHHWVRTLPSHGHLVVNASDEALARVMARKTYTPLTYIHSPAGWAIAPLASTGPSASGHDVFDVLYCGRVAGRVESPLTGDHNRSNTLAAIAAAVAVGVPVNTACDAISRFAGVKRRLQSRGEVGGVTVLDDFAHHPTAIATTIAGRRDQRARQGDRGRLLAVIEPRSNTMKLGIMASRLADSLRAADKTFAYAGGIDWDLTGALRSLGPSAQVHTSIDALLAAIVAEARPGDDVLVMSNGGFGGLHDKLLAALRSRASGGQNG
ncbi:MAG: UDP-N-acetylmuramate:L-alanyl-gamma-D-glutamyl-meso-diaminopimelate ligase [Limnohabitans sp.]|nr:UDP-N-acetylmuramate:L-alanyl-gamma-D-glutamyl-meso-diaminopimelate ligase [Limnohabitans sp.]